MNLHLIQIVMSSAFLFVSFTYSYSGSHAYNKTSIEKVSVNAATGAFDFSYPIISWRGIRETFELNLTYRFNRKGLFGLPQGWQLDLGFIDGETANIHGQQWLIDPLWRDETLNASGLKYYNQHGTVFIDQIEEKPIPGFTGFIFRYVLKHNDGSFCYFSHQGLLVLKVDRFKNAIAFNYQQPVRSLESAKLDSIVDNYGNAYQFVYAPNEMRIVMPDQREMIVYTNNDGIIKIVDPLKLYTDISYVKAFNRNLLRTIESPSGLFVSLTYNSIHIKNGGKTQEMPVVESLEKIDRASSKILEQTHYKYSPDNNFTGFPKYSLSDKTDNLMDSNDQSYRYWVQITKSDLGKPPKFHSQLFYYNYLHLPVEITTLKEGRPYLKTVYEYMISPFKYSRSTNYDKPKTVNRSLWSQQHHWFVDTERNTKNYDRYGKKTFEEHEVYDRVNGKWNKISNSIHTYFSDYSLKQSTTKTDFVTGQKLKKSYTLSQDKKTHQSSEVSFVQGENSEQWQPWQQEDFKHDTYGRKTHHARRWLTKNYPGPEVTSLDFNYDFDSNSKALTVSQIKASGAATQSIVDTRNNQQISHVTPLNETWHYHYDALNRPTGMIDPLGHATSHRYDDYQAAGANMVIVTSPLGYKTRTTLNAKHQPIHQHDYFDNQWRHLSSHRYDGLGKVIAQTDINQLTSTTEFDELERPLVHVDGYGNTTEFSYDDYLLTTTLYLNKHKIHQKLSEPWNVLTRTRFYPNFDNPRESQSGFIEHTIKHSGFKKKIEESNSIIDRYSSTTKDTVTRRFSYDASLNVTEENTCGFNGTQFAIKYTHDIFNHAVTKQKTLTENNAVSASVGDTFLYDADGQLIEKRSPVSASGKQLTTHFSYNKNGQKVKAVLPSGKTITQNYNALGLPNKSSWLREGKPYEMTHEYDADRRLTSVKDSQGQTINFSYLENGFLTGMHYPDGQSIEVSYDDKNRKLTEKNLGGPVHHFHYDAKDAGKVSSIRSGDLTVNYRYGIDDNGVNHQLIERVSDHPKTGGTVESIIYGSQGIPINTQVHNQKSGAVYEVDYVFNPRKQLMCLSSHHHKGHSTPESAKMQYNYNALNQLIYEKVTNLDTSRELHYQYDANGNMILEKEMSDGTLSNTAFVYNPLDQLVEIASDYAPGSGNLSYDKDGRLTKDHQGLEYAYDDKGYLLSVNTPNSRIHYDYWPNGHLSQRKVAGAVASPAAQIYHDLEKNIVAINSDDHWRYLLKNNKNTLASFEVLSKAGPSQKSSNENTYTESTGVNENTMDEWFMINHSVGALLSETGNLSTQHYMAYGKPLNTDLSDTPDFFWHQNYSDTVSGLVYFKSRFYSPTLKRFITPDNLLIDNRYRYAKSNPLFYYDPTGHSVSDANWGVGLTMIVFGVAGVGLALPSGGASLTLTGEAAVAAAASTTVSGTALLGSQMALYAGNKEVAKRLQFTSIGFGAAGLVLSAGSLAPAINAFRATGQFSLASHWYNTTPIWENIASQVPGARVAEGGTALMLTGRTAGEKLTESAQHAAALTDSQWVRVLGPHPSITEIASKINELGHVPPELVLDIESPHWSSVYAISGSLGTMALDSFDLFQSYSSTDAEDTDTESTAGKTDQTKKTESTPVTQVLNWTEIRAHRNTSAPIQTLANDAFSSGAKEPFGLFGDHQ